jgi:spermidine synthase
VLGLASGISAGEVLHYPVEKLDVIEINQQVVHASDFFRPWNNNVLSNPRTQLIIQDGRAHMALTNRTYDVVISEPSNPWMAGLASLFTKDFFEMVKNRLNTNGIFVQWVHSYQIDWADFALIGRTFHKVFPNSVLVSTGLFGSVPDYMLIGFYRDGGVDMNAAVKNFPYSRKTGNMVLTNPLVCYSLIVNEDLGRLFGEGPVNTDNRPLLEFSAPKVMHFNDSTINARIGSESWLSPKTVNIIREFNANIDSQIDRAVFSLSFNSPTRDMVDLAKATPEQRARYIGILTDYCSKNVVQDFSFINDPELQKMCIATQIEVMKKKIQTVSDKDRLFFHLANLYLLMNNSEEAVNYYKMSISANPRYDRAYFNLGNVLSEMNRLDEAEKLYREAIRIYPYYAKAYHNFGNILARQGKMEEAAQKFKKALELDPGNIQSHRNLGFVLKKLGRTAEGDRHLEEAARLSENAPGRQQR